MKLLFHLFENSNAARGKCCYTCCQRKWDYVAHQYRCDILQRQVKENYICTNFMWWDGKSNTIHREWTYPPAAIP